MPYSTCSEPDCDRPIKGHGLCKRHYDRAKRNGLLGGTPCKADGCDRVAYSRGYCTLHVQRFHKHGDPNHVTPKINGGPCSVDGCEKVATQRGVCPMHYRRARVHGTTKERPKRKPAPPKTCKMDGCEGRVVGYGYCSKHYERFRKHGDPTVVKTTAKPPRPCKVDGCSENMRTRGMCPHHYSKWRKHGDPNWTAPTWQEKFWGHVRKTESCWIWTGTTTREGYGKTALGGRKRGAHRASWEIANGPIPDGMQVDHKCHNPSCVNPDHLRLATPAQNSEYRRGANSGNRSGYRGVTWYKQVGKWRARVMHHGVNYELGNFDDPYEAHLAVVAKRKELHHWDAPDNHIGRAA